MTLLSSILLGIIQGVAEFLPISSSGHLAIAEHLLGMSGVSDIPEFFDVLLHLGTLAAVFVAYWPEIRDMILEFFRGVSDLAHHSTPARIPPARRLILLIIVGTLPLFLILPIKDKIEGLSDNMYFIAFALIFTGVMLYLCDTVR
ncbi:MAG: undecaprenyl-diphosphate phosphatase, partial [Oscillospiraceae bacterium]|nr:undecaprenyl-diphosphate phosphatase [Oscillospiraceae bacterium]